MLAHRTAELSLGFESSLLGYAALLPARTKFTPWKLHPEQLDLGVLTASARAGGRSFMALRYQCRTD